jgi:hypothetical protein
MSRFVSASLSIPAALALAGAAFAQGATAPPDLQSNDIAWIAMNNDLGQPAAGLGPTSPIRGIPIFPMEGARSRHSESATRPIQI